MAIVKIDALDGGVNELANAETLKDSQLKASQNYEILGDDKLTLRKEPEEYGDHVSGDSLKTVLDAIFSSSILQISPPLYPVKRIVDDTGTRIMDGEFIILVYGLSGTDFKLYLCYEDTSNTWTATQVDITGIEYTSNTYLEFFVGDDKMIITDTFNETTNFPHYVKIDGDGDLITGLFSIKSPTNKATLLPVTEYNSAEFEEDVDDVRLDDCGIVQCVYTVITKDGDESNPSPISNSRMMQFFKKDLVDKNDIRWIDNFQITNLSVPVLTGDLTEELKYFNVYFRVIRYSEGEAAEPFFFSQRFDIVDKENNEGDTGNGYLITTPQDESALLSYENDIAPFAKHAAETAGIVGFANIREKIRFPFNFEKYCTIAINNVNNKNFVDAIVQIRLYDKNSGATDLIDDLDLTYYDLSDDDYMTNLDLIRIYDGDLTTPLKVFYEKYTGGTYLDLYVKIPLLIAGQLKTIYLCFNTSTGSELGVITDEYKTVEYGHFTKLDSDVLSEMFDSDRVKSNKTLICSPMDYMKGDEVLNLADDNNPGEIFGDEGGWEAVPLRQLFTQGVIGSGSYLLKGESGDGDDFSEIRYLEMGITTVPEKCLMYFRMQYETLPQGVEKIIGCFNTDSRNKAYALSCEYLDGEIRWKLGVFRFTDRVDDRGSMPFSEIPTTDEGEVFIALSFDRGENASLFVGNLLTGSFYRQELEWDDDLPYLDGDGDGADYVNDVESFSLGRNDYPSGHYPGNFQFYISQFQLIINKYYSANDDDDITAIYNIANFMPGFEAALGQKITTED